MSDPTQPGTPSPDPVDILKQAGYQYEPEFNTWSHNGNQVEFWIPYRCLKLYAEKQGLDAPGQWALAALGVAQNTWSKPPDIPLENSGGAAEGAEPTELVIQGKPVAEWSAADASVEEEAKRRCREIWEAPDTLNRIVEYAQQVHVGDTIPLQILFLAALQERIVDLSETFYVTVNGGTGAGKSHITSTLRDILPTGSVLKSGITDKVLSRAGKKYDGKIIVFDDWQPTPVVIEQLKICSERGAEPPIWSTLEPGAGGKLVCTEYTLPERICFVIARVDTAWGCDEEQIRNRVVPVYLDDSEEQNRATQVRLAKSFVEEHVDPFREMHPYMRKYLWNHLPEKIWVDGAKIENHIESRVAKGDRSLVHLYNLILCYAVYRQWKGDPDSWPDRTRSGLPKIYAEKEDAVRIIDLMNKLYQPQSPKSRHTDPNAGGGRYKMPLAAKRLVDWLLEHYPDTFRVWESERALAREMGKAQMTVHNALYSQVNGEGGRGVGALMIVPGLTSEKVVISRPASEDDNPEVRRGDYARVGRERHEIRWDPFEYQEAQAEGPLFRWVD